MNQLLLTKNESIIVFYSINVRFRKYYQWK